ncbi:hypothetical protein CAP36_02900 [Chitinophagaceae bacterium IBVUCB2]|nr:hypothetical protein CAP36_02900 [Chitinophagaceae bacterium IBVUCB2]
MGSLLVISSSIKAQQFGGTPPAQKWKQINTDSARIIFPAGLDSQANRIASIVHYLASKSMPGSGSTSLGDQLKKINIVLQHQTTVANGYVGLGPYRSEFYLTPALNNFDQGTVSWGDQLALHEYRHVQQFNNFNNGLSKAMKVLFGEDGYALAINAAIPDWFYEGDAVYNETVMSKQGRGRLPLFLNAYPSIWQAGKKYSWMKLRNGSLKDYVPDHYKLGYLLVNYGREKYGADFWTQVTKDASAYKGLLYPFQVAIKTHAGIDYKTFREQAFDFYEKKTERVSVSRDEYVFPVKKNYVTNYYFPYNAGEDSLIYLKTSYRHRPAFYLKDKTGEHKLKVRDVSNDEQFSYRNGMIVYAAYENDARWSWRDYSVIKMLDISTGQQKTLTKKSKYFTPDISADGSKVAAVQVSANGKSELHILDASNGQVLQSIHSAEINLFTDPKFIDDNNLVTAVRLRDGSTALATAEIGTGNTVRLTNPSFNVVGYPSVSNGVVYFTASYGGNDDVFALRLSDKKIYKISNGPLGNYFVNAGNGKVAWSVFTAEGYQLKQINEKDIVWNEVSSAATEQLTEKFPVFQSGKSSELLPANLPQRNFQVSNYSKGTGLFNFHSWRPYYSDPIFTYSLYGQNVLNTFETELFYSYNQNERLSSVGLNAVYGGWFPFLNVGTEMTLNRETQIGNKIRQWNQLDTRIGLTVPLTKTKGQTFRSFNAGSFYVLRNEFNKDFYKDSLGTTSFSYLLHLFSYTQQVQRAVQHIYPRLAYSVSANHRHAISYYEGYQFIGTASVYVPGVLSTHNIIVTGAFQQRDTSLALFSSRFPNARGFNDFYRTNAGSRMLGLSVNYHLPLLYPDWGFGNILYLQRFRANLFYDFQRLYSNNKKNKLDFRSIGGEFFVDTKWWNQYPLTFGFRISILQDRDPLNGNQKGTSIFEFIVPVNIIPR